MKRAIDFGYESIRVFKSLFGEKTIEEKAKELANILYDWLVKNSRNGKMEFLKSHIYNYGPNQLRNKENLEMALWRLHNDRNVHYYVDSKPAFIRLLDINHYLR